MHAHFGDIRDGFLLDTDQVAGIHRSDCIPVEENHESKVTKRKVHLIRADYRWKIGVPACSVFELCEHLDDRDRPRSYIPLGIYRVQKMQEGT